MKGNLLSGNAMENTMTKEEYELMTNLISKVEDITGSIDMDELWHFLPSWDEVEYCIKTAPIRKVCDKIVTLIEEHYVNKVFATYSIDLPNEHLFDPCARFSVHLRNTFKFEDYIIFFNSKDMSCWDDSTFFQDLIHKLTNWLDTFVKGEEHESGDR